MNINTIGRSFNRRLGLLVIAALLLTILATAARPATAGVSGEVNVTNGPAAQQQGVYVSLYDEGNAAGEGFVVSSFNQYDPVTQSKYLMVGDSPYQFPRLLYGPYHVYATARPGFSTRIECDAAQECLVSGDPVNGGQVAFFDVSPGKQNVFKIRIYVRALGNPPAPVTVRAAGTTDRKLTFDWEERGGPYLNRATRSIGGGDQFQLNTHLGSATTISMRPDSRYSAGSISCEPAAYCSIDLVNQRVLLEAPTAADGRPPISVTFELEEPEPVIYLNLDDAGGAAGQPFQISYRDIMSDDPKEEHATIAVGTRRIIPRSSDADSYEVAIYEVYIEDQPGYTVVDVKCSPEQQCKIDSRPPGKTLVLLAYTADEAPIGVYKISIKRDTAAAFVSMSSSGSLDSSDVDAALTYDHADILRYDGEGWEMWFDSHAAGLRPDLGRSVHNINAFYIPYPGGQEVILSFNADEQYVPGIDRPVHGSDLVEWDGERWSLYFNGIDVGLKPRSTERIDGLDILHYVPEWSAYAGKPCKDYLLISTQGPGVIAKPNTYRPVKALRFSGEDILGFCALTLGGRTTGYWEMVVDGSETRPAFLKNSIDSISLEDDGDTAHVTLRERDSRHSQVFEIDLATKQVTGPFFIVADTGLSGHVDGMQVEGEYQGLDE